jgi:hypothetical protein
MAKGQATSSAFEVAASNTEAAPKPLMCPEEYQSLLENLLADGDGMGKTEPVAAYQMSDMRLVTEKDTQKTEQQIKIERLYLVMDLKVYPNTYARSLTVQEIAVSYARRILGEGDINSPDFDGPGVWTTKKEAFEFDYTPRKSGEIYDSFGRPNSIYDPCPDAYRICLTVKQPITIPTQWGQPYEIETGGALAIRERDVRALSDALQSVRDGLMTVQQALYKDNTSTARFDVYGMDPGFLKDNYNKVALKPETMKIKQLFEQHTPRIIPLSAKR